MEIELVRGTRRRKHVAGELVGDRLRVSFPRWMTVEQARETAEELRARMERRIGTERFDLARRARDLSRCHGLPVAESVSWADNQLRRWGSCSPETRSVRVSSRLSAYPTWVLDYVIVHELAHIAEPGHDAAFHDLVGRYAFAERARGFLIAKDLDPESDL